MPDVSPPKWHLAHTTWFFETFIASRFIPGYRVFHPAFHDLFNSYYQSVGSPWERSRRGLLSRPGVEEIYRYRHHVDQALEAFLNGGATLHEGDRELGALLELGLQHEQQHQELLLMDIKHIFWSNPLRPSYSEEALSARFPRSAQDEEWWDFAGGLHEIGARGDEGFAFDNERPRHVVHLEPFRLSSRPVTNGEFLEFIEAGGYEDARWWLSEGWAKVVSEKWEAPLYWERQAGRWSVMTLRGMDAFRPEEPVCHVSYLEADAYARWKGCRLPAEAEWEVASASRRIKASCWEWTSSPYQAYPGYRPWSGSLGEYNGKFMCNQYVLRGDSIATPAGHSRLTYRNFYPAASRWQFSGIRLACDRDRKTEGGE